MSNTDKGAALSDVLASAPRHGMNAKALLLQAAALAAQEAASLEGEAPLAISEREQQIAKLKAAFVASSKLLTGIPKRESPVVAYVNTAKVNQHSRCSSTCDIYQKKDTCADKYHDMPAQVPRIVRQQVLQKLVGQHLAAALLDSGAECSAAEVAARHSTRKAAMAAATEQELQLFKSCLSKAVSSAKQHAHVQPLQHLPAPNLYQHIQLSICLSCRATRIWQPVQMQARYCSPQNFP